VEQPWVDVVVLCLQAYCYGVFVEEDHLGLVRNVIEG
jgi:hypothetical protein